MDSRQRIQYSLNHKEPDKLPVDFGSTPATGMHVRIIYKLRQYFGLDEPGCPVKLLDPFMMLGEIKDDLRQVIGIDTVMLAGKGNLLGFNNDNWKEWKMWDGTPLLVPGLFNTEKNKDGSLFQYPQGDKKCLPVSKMPKEGYFFDSVIRQDKIIEEELNSADNLEEFGFLSKESLDYFKNAAQNLYDNTRYSITALIESHCSSFGDFFCIPAPMLKNPKGIRDPQEWLVSNITRKSYIKEVFEKQCDIAVENYRRAYGAVGNKIDVVFITGTDFGMQTGLIVSKDIYRQLYKPYHKKINDWIHKNTGWKTFIHTCGSIYELIPDLVDAGFDILNPVQISARDMEPEKLKKEFGKDVVFWGGGVDTQKTLSYGKPIEVKEQVKELIDIFSPGGGFVFSTVHNIEPNVPVENIIAMIDVIHEYRN